MDSLRFIFELNARVAGLVAAVREVRRFQGAVLGAGSVVRSAGGRIGQELGGVSLAARGAGLALAGIGAARGGIEAISLGAAQARAQLGALAGSVVNLRNVLLAGAAAYGTKLVVDSVAFKENALIAFETLVGSRREAERLLREAVRFAAATPFETRDVIEAYQRLLTAGFRPVEIPVVLRGVGDLAAMRGMSREVMDRVLYAITQIRAKGRLQGEELMQLAEAGVPLARVYEVLARRIGATTEQARKLQEAGRISADLGVVAVLEAVRDTVSGGRLGGLMDRMSTSISGLLSTLRSRALEFTMDIDLSPLRALLQNLVTLTDTSGRVGARFKALVENLIGGTLRSAFGSLAEATDPRQAEANLMGFLDRVEAGFRGLRAFLASVLPAVREVLAGMGAGFRLVREAAEAVAPVVGLVGRALGGLSESATQAGTSSLALVGTGLALAATWKALNLLTLGLAGNMVRWGVLSVAAFARATAAALAYAAAHRGAMVAAFSAGVGQVGGMLASLLPALGRIGLGILRLMGPWGLVASAAVAAGGLILRHWGSIAGWLGSMWGRVKGAASGAWSGIVGTVLAAGERIGVYLASLWGSLKAGFQGFAQGVLAWLQSLPSRIGEALRGLGPRLAEGVRAAIGALPGGNLILQGLDMAGRAVRGAYEWARGVGQAVLGGAKEVLGIRSPSREFYRLGLASVAGFAMGLGQVGPVERAAAGLGAALGAVQPPALAAPRPAPSVPAPVAAAVRAGTTVYITVEGARAPREVAREVVEAIDRWSAGRIVVLGLEALAAEVGHDA